ncbi:Viral IAP-associated factor, partial [Operophtera brumata]
NPNEDTEWNDVLRAKGILPPKEKEVSEDEIINMIEQTIQHKQAEKFEYILGKVGAVDTKITEDPKPKIKDKMFSDLGSNDW